MTEIDSILFQHVSNFKYKYKGQKPIKITEKVVPEQNSSVMINRFFSQQDLHNNTVITTVQGIVKILKDKTITTKEQSIKGIIQHPGSFGNDFTHEQYLMRIIRELYGPNSKNYKKITKTPFYDYIQNQSTENIKSYLDNFVPNNSSDDVSIFSCSTMKSEYESNPEIPMFDHIVSSVSSANLKLDAPLKEYDTTEVSAVETKIEEHYKETSTSVKEKLRSGYNPGTNGHCDDLHNCIHYCINQITDLLHDVEKNGNYVTYLYEILKSKIDDMSKSKIDDMSNKCQYNLNHLNSYQGFLKYLGSVKTGEQTISQQTLHKYREHFFKIFIDNPNLKAFKDNYKTPVAVTKEECYHSIMAELLKREVDSGAFIYPESGRRPYYDKLDEFYKDKENETDFFVKYPDTEKNAIESFFINKKFEKNQHIIQNHVSNFDAAPRTVTHQDASQDEGSYEIDNVLCKYKYVIYVKNDSNDSNDTNGRRFYLVVVYEKQNDEIQGVFGFKGAVSINLLLNQIGIQTSRQGDGETGGNFYPINIILNTIGMDTSEPTQDRHVDEPERKKKLNQKGIMTGTDVLHTVRDFVNNMSNEFVDGNVPTSPIIVYKKDLTEPIKQTLTLLNKTNGDTLAQLFEEVTRYIFTVDSLVPHTFYMLYTSNIQDHCPTVFRQSGNGFIKYFGIETVNAAVKAKQIIKKLWFMRRFLIFYNKYNKLNGDSTDENDWKVTPDANSDVFSTVSEDTAYGADMSQDMSQDTASQYMSQDTASQKPLNRWVSYPTTNYIPTLKPIDSGSYNGSDNGSDNDADQEDNDGDEDYEQTLNLNRIDNLLDLYMNHIPKINSVSQIENNPYKMIMLLLQIAEADHIKNKIDDYYKKIKILDLKVNCQQDDKSYFEDIKDKGLKFFENVSNMPGIDNFKSSVNKHAIIQEAHDNDIIARIFQNIPFENWSLECTEQNVILTFNSSNRIKETSVQQNVKYLDNLNTITKGLDDVRYIADKGTDDQQHKVTIPITLDVLLQLYEHPKLIDGKLREIIREQIDIMINTIVETSFKDYNIASLKTSMTSVLNHVSNIVQNGHVINRKSRNSNATTFLLLKQLPKGGSLQNRPKKRFDFRANTKNNYSALSKIMTIKTTNKTKKSRKKKNKTKKSHKKKKKKRQTKRR